MTNSYTSLSGQLLISLPSMQGDYFTHTVTLLIEHNQDGAFGLVVNRPLDANLGDLLTEQNVDFAHDLHGKIPLLESGPVEQNRLFFLHSADTNYKNSIHINEEVCLCTSLDLLKAISSHEGPKDIIAGLGYAGWSGGQLENEIKADVWLVTPYLHNAVFNTPYDERPQLAASSIGIDLNLISPTPGHG
ncbi:MAG: YqgE/AlgH family protein [Gammaproteobacteria bacterium]|jgi:putative transcriptional regulator|nr:YqgE/AlgH family protein [Gammaproteobacteria bacterium]MBT4493893.1 YqgE/AlgH family protein [Gammaproteobacteria bacterium]MBT7372126.1 YqgE/AlgH family protein [Gammaproteobacteria bacterium]